MTQHTSRFWFVIMTVAMAGCAPASCQTPSPEEPTADARAVSPAPDVLRFEVGSGRALVVTGKTATVLNTKEQLVAANDTLIRLRDEGGSCMAEGFFDAKAVADGFLIEQQNCSGWDIINETLTFRRGGDGAILLTGAQLTYIDRRAPEDAPRIYAFDGEDFGPVTFEKLDMEDVYDLISR